jgi:CHAT domain-containing protein
MREQLGLTLPAPTAQQVRDSLPDDVALIEYAPTPKSIAAFIVTKRDIAVVEITVDRENLRSTADRFRRAIVDHENVTSIRDDGGRLYDILLSPLQDRIRMVHELILVPDRGLRDLPFSALVNPRTGRYAIEDFAWSVATSAAVLRSRAPEATMAGPALIVGNPAVAGAEDLPDAGREAARIARLYSGATLLVSREATAARVRALLPIASFIHYAGHAQWETGKEIALQLAGEDSNLLTRAEIAGLRLKARLAVIAACGSGGADVEHVEGGASLATAFLSAGVPTVVATLWDIDDQVAAPLFEEFHEKLAEGLTASRALQATQQMALTSSNPSLAHPAAWAAVSVFGRGSTLINERQHQP